MTALYPVCLRLAQRPVLVVGGGKIALRKVDRLLACDAQVTLVAPDLVDKLMEYAQADRLTWHARPFTPSDCDGACLVLSASGDLEVDGQVAAAARARGVWVNLADDDPQSDLVLPALVQQGALTLAVSTAGHAPGFAARLVREISDQLGPGLGDYVSLLGEVRTSLRQRFPDDRVRRARAFKAALDCQDGRRAASQGRLDEARQRLALAVAAALGPGAVRDR